MAGGFAEMLTLWLALVFIVGVGFLVYMILDSYFQPKSKIDDESAWEDDL